MGGWLGGDRLLAGCHKGFRCSFGCVSLNVWMSGCGNVRLDARCLEGRMSGCVDVGVLGMLGCIHVWMSECTLIHTVHVIFGRCFFFLRKTTSQ